MPRLPRWGYAISVIRGWNMLSLGLRKPIPEVSRCGALQPAPEGVRVNAVAAGLPETDFFARRMRLTTGQLEAK